MSRLFASTQGPADWQQYLAHPEKQWKRGKSARTIAHAWEAANGVFPPEIQTLLETAADTALHALRPLLAIPEFKVELPGGSAASQNDVFVIGSCEGGAVTMMVEGKVSESFDVILDKWGRNPSRGKKERWAYLNEKLGLQLEAKGPLRYQLFHRLASAVIEAERLRAAYALMVIHSFSETDAGFADYVAFLDVFSAKAGVGALTHLGNHNGIALLAGWARGDKRFLHS